MLPPGFWKQPADVVFDERQISNGHIAGERGANSSVAVRRFVGKNLCWRLNFERFRQDRLVACVRRLDVGDDLRCVGETIGESALMDNFTATSGNSKRAFVLQDLRREHTSRSTGNEKHESWNQTERDALGGRVL